MTEQQWGRWGGDWGRWGGDGLGPEDIATPEIKLIQSVGGAFAKSAGAFPGDFYCSLTDETIKGEEGFDLVIVAMQKNRTYWGREDIADAPPICASLNAASMLSINGEDCKLCPHRNEVPWLLSPAERRTKCLVSYNILAIGMDYFPFPVLIRTSGISAQAAKELYTQLCLNKHLIGAWYKAKTHVTSIKKKTSSGDAYAIKFGKLELIQDQKLLEELGPQSNQLIRVQIDLPEGREQEIPTKPTPKPTPTPTPILPGALKPAPVKATPPARVQARSSEPEPEIDIDMSF